MKLILSRTAQGLIALSASALIAACGSGNNTSVADGGVPLVPGTDVPVSATENSQAAFDFVSSVVAKGEANTDTPLVIGDAELAVSEIVEPAFVAA